MYGFSSTTVPERYKQSRGLGGSVLLGPKSFCLVYSCLLEYCPRPHGRSGPTVTRRELPACRQRKDTGMPKLNTSLLLTHHWPVLRS